MVVVVFVLKETRGVGTLGWKGRGDGVVGEAGLLGDGIVVSEKMR